MFFEVFFRLFTLFAAPAIELKQTTRRSDVSGNKKEEIGTTLLQTQGSQGSNKPVFLLFLETIIEKKIWNFFLEFFLFFCGIFL
jgi:hypothetical protein